jgi:Flp pilus assembly protein TadD
MALERSTLDSAIVTLERELHDGRGSRAYAPLAEAYRLEGRLDDAIRVGRAGVQAYPGHVAIRIVLARTLAEASQAGDAREAYEEVLRLDPSSSEARIALGLLGRRPTTAPPPAARTRPDGPASLSEELAHLSDLF